GSNLPAGNSTITARMGWRYCRSSTTRPSSSSAITITAPGCSTYSRVASVPAGRRTVSRTTCRKCPRSSSVRASGTSFRCSSAMPLLVEVAVDEAREGQGGKEGGGGGVELPALRVDLASTVLEPQAERADHEV